MKKTAKKTSFIARRDTLNRTCNTCADFSKSITEKPCFDCISSPTTNRLLWTPAPVEK